MPGRRTRSGVGVRLCRKKESERRVRGLLGVVEWYRCRDKEENYKIISVWHNHVLSEKAGQIVPNLPVLPLEFELCSKSTRLTSQISHKTLLRSISRANLQKADERTDEISLPPLDERHWSPVQLWELERRELILIECIYFLISFVLFPQPREHRIWHKNGLSFIPSTLVDLKKEGALWRLLCFHMEFMVSGSEMLQKSP